MCSGNFVYEQIDKKIPVSIFLINGIKLQGRILSIDYNTGSLLLKGSGTQLINLHAIATIVPQYEY